MYRNDAHEATHRTPTTHPAEPPTLRGLAVAVAAPPALVWAATYPAAALSAVALVAVVVWHRRGAGATGRPRPTEPPG